MEENYDLHRAISTAPVSAPLAMEFHGSSFFRICINKQSNDENMPPQTAKLPRKATISIYSYSSQCSITYLNPI